jgi:hypothetical protein
VASHGVYRDDASLERQSFQKRLGTLDFLARCLFMERLGAYAVRYRSSSVQVNDNQSARHPLYQRDIRCQCQQRILVLLLPRRSQRRVAYRTIETESGIPQKPVHLVIDGLPAHKKLCIKGKVCVKRSKNNSLKFRKCLNSFDHFSVHILSPILATSE